MRRGQSIVGARLGDWSERLNGVRWSGEKPEEIHEPAPAKEPRATGAPNARQLRQFRFATALDPTSTSLGTTRYYTIVR